MGLLDFFSLAKLQIKSFSDEQRTSALGDMFVQFNPESLSLRHEIGLRTDQGVGTNAGRGAYTHTRSRTLSVSFVFDGTNVGYMGVELFGAVDTVADQIAKFLLLTHGQHPETHEPPYLKLLWNEAVLGPSYDCRLQSVDIRHQSFDRDGSPLHSELAATFFEGADPELQAGKSPTRSPDLTHRRVVKGGDTLPALCREIYGSADHYLRVAEVNGLDDVRFLEPGTALVFPPFARKVRR